MVHRSLGGLGAGVSERGGAKDVPGCWEYSAGRQGDSEKRKALWEPRLAQWMLVPTHKAHPVAPTCRWTGREVLAGYSRVWATDSKRERHGCQHLPELLSSQTPRRKGCPPPGEGSWGGGFHGSAVWRRVSLGTRREQGCPGQQWLGCRRRGGVSSGLRRARAA